MTMNRNVALRLCILIWLFPLLAACGAPSAAQVEQATPTPLPPDTALERPTYTVKRDAIDELLTVNGRVTPVDLTRLSFKRDGRVNTVGFARGDTVKQGDLLAELQQEDQLDELREAKDGLLQSQRDLANAQKEQAKKVEQAQLELDNAQEDLKRVLPGGEDDPIRAAQQALEDARREAKDAGDSGSESKTEAEYAVLKSA